MKPVFADALYFLALLNKRDQYHERASEFASLVIEGVTSEFVLMEVADGLADTPLRKEFPHFYARLKVDPTATIVPGDSELFAAGLRLYTDRPDKEWSLTDCTSFVVMNRLGLTDALTADHHFEQAGFIALLR